MTELTKQQIERQDFVDNKIIETLYVLRPKTLRALRGRSCAVSGRGAQ